MKKIGVAIAVLLLTSQVFAKDAVPSEIDDLQKDYEQLLQQEENRFQEEKRLAKKAEEKILQLEEWKGEIQQVLGEAEEERKKRFFKKDYDQLTKKYKDYVTKLEEEINRNNKIVHDFNQIELVY